MSNEIVAMVTIEYDSYICHIDLGHNYLPCKRNFVCNYSHRTGHMHYICSGTQKKDSLTLAFSVNVFLPLTVQS